MNKAVFLDRDGTINIDKNYLHKPDEFELLPGVLEGLKKLQAAGYLLIVITNQSGIARGYYSESDFQVLNNYMLHLFEKNGVRIQDVFYCPHHPYALIEKYKCECNCRKPNLGMYYSAVEKWEIDLDTSWAIGDKARDCAICENSNCRGIIIQSDEKNIQEKETLYARNLNEAADIILNMNSVGANE